MSACTHHASRVAQTGLMNGIGRGKVGAPSQLLCDRRRKLRAAGVCVCLCVVVVVVVWLPPLTDDNLIRHLPARVNADRRPCGLGWAGLGSAASPFSSLKLHNTHQSFCRANLLLDLAIKRQSTST